MLSSAARRPSRTATATPTRAASSTTIARLSTGVLKTVIRPPSVGANDDYEITWMGHTLQVGSGSLTGTAGLSRRRSAATASTFAHS